jgi:hypothetical protein
VAVFRLALLGRLVAYGVVLSLTAAFAASTIAINLHQTSAHPSLILMRLLAVAKLTNGVEKVPARNVPPEVFWKHTMEKEPPEVFYRVALACDGVPAEAGAQAATDITEEFKRRPWHRNVVCRWDRHALILQAENDFDPEGLALIDEFSDAISTCIANDFDGNISVICDLKRAGRWR